MTKQMQISYEILHENNSYEDILKSYDQPLRDYESEIPNLPVLDIGIGLGEEPIYHASKGRKVYAVDNEQTVLDMLKAKIIDKNLDVQFILQSFPNISIPEKQLSCIVMSNLLHFFDDYEAMKLDVQKISNYIVSGGFLLIRVHSTDHTLNKPGNDKTHFKHFFTEAEVKGLVDSSDFQLVYFSKYYRKFGKRIRDHREKWLPRVWVEAMKKQLTNPHYHDWYQLNINAPDEDCFIALFKKKTSTIEQREGLAGHVRLTSLRNLLKIHYVN